MDDLFKLANKYSMHEDDVRTATQQVLVTSRPAKNDLARIPRPRANRGKWVEGKASSTSQTKSASPL